MKIIIKPKAEKSITSIGIYIHEKGYPFNADTYLDRLKKFAHSLSAFPGKYPICTQNKFSKRNLRCAVFDRTYIFIYKTVKNELIIYNVIHGRRLK